MVLLESPPGRTGFRKNTLQDLRRLSIDAAAIGENSPDPGIHVAKKAVDNL